MKCSVFFLLIVMVTLFTFDIEAQITPNNVDSLGLRQDMWREFKVPFYLVTEKIGIKVPVSTSDYYYLTKDEDRKFFPIIECVGKYKNGLKIGNWFEYYGDGTIKSQIEYKDGVPMGKCKTYWGTGALKEEYTITPEDSIHILIYDINGDILIDRMVSKTGVIRAIYEN